MTVVLSTGLPLKIDQILHMEVLISMDIGETETRCKKMSFSQVSRTCNRRTLTVEFTDVSIPQLAHMIFTC